MMRLLLFIAFFVSLPISVQEPKASRAAELRAEIARLKKRLAELEKELEAIAPRKNIAPIYINELAVGSKGIVSYPDNVAGERGKPVLVAVVQVIDSKNVIVRTFGKYRLWLKMDTAGFVDGREFRLSDPLHVSGTKTRGGSTMFVLEPIE